MSLDNNNTFEDTVEIQITEFIYVLNGYGATLKVSKKDFKKLENATEEEQGKILEDLVVTYNVEWFGDSEPYNEITMSSDMSYEYGGIA